MNSPHIPFDGPKREPFRVLSLFAGIGGFDLGLERTGGFKTVAFCEIDPFCRRVLAKHWPGVPCYDDVRTLTAERLATDGIEPDCIVGGFPCQDISAAGRGAGIEGERSGLWSEFARLIGEIRPAYVIVENVAALLARGLDRVLGDLAALGYDADWNCIPASAIGAPHRRDRIWVVAYPDCGPVEGGLDARTDSGAASASESRDAGEGQAPHRQRLRPELGASGPLLSSADAAAMLGAAIIGGEPDGNNAGAGTVADPASVGCGQGRARRFAAPSQMREAERADVSNSARLRPHDGRRFELAESCEGAWGFDQWRTEPDVGRVAHGVPARVDRLRSLGNAVVPQIPELIGRAILEAEAA